MWGFFLSVLSILKKLRFWDCFFIWDGFYFLSQFGVIYGFLFRFFFQINFQVKINSKIMFNGFDCKDIFFILLHLFLFF